MLIQKYLFAIKSYLPAAKQNGSTINKGRWMYSLMNISVFILSHFSSYSQSNVNFQLLKVTIDNDLFLLPRDQTDRYYTDGSRIDFYFTTLKKKSISKLLFTLDGQVENLYNFSITQQIYTPNNTAASEIQIGDRPYAGTLFASLGLVSSNRRLAQRLSSEISMGVIGPSAFAKELQTWFHKFIGNNPPNGWQNQIRNDVILNYLLLYEKRLVKASSGVELIGLTGFNFGTLINNLDLGFTFRYGIYNSYFSNYEKLGVNPKGIPKWQAKSYQVYVYIKPVFQMIFSNALLQGGPFSYSENLYRIERDRINSLVLQFEYGFVIGYKKMGISVSQRSKTSEFSNAFNTQYGSISLYVGI